MIAQDVYRGIEARFRQNGRLVTLLRRTYFGSPSADEKEYMPHIRVSIDLVEGLDTYDENVARYRVRFEVRTKHVRVEDVQAAMRHLAATFDDAEFDVGGLSFTDCSRVEEVDPEMIDGVYEASVSYDVIVASRAKTPYFTKR